MSSGPLRVVCGIVFHGEKLLATRRDPKRTFPLLWEFPGGKVEDAESPEAALHRELEEELSLKVEVVQALDPLIYQADGHHLELIPFLCRPAQSHGIVPHDHIEARWIRPEAAPSLEWAPADIPLVGKLPHWQAPDDVPARAFAFPPKSPIPET